MPLIRRLSEADVILICVPTPLTSSRDPDLRYVESTTNAIAAALRPGQLVVLESTTYPGTTKDVLLPILKESGLQGKRPSEPLLTATLFWGFSDNSIRSPAYGPSH